MTRIRVAIVADLREEGWPSMDLVADMLVRHLDTEHGAGIEAELVRPAMRRRASRLSSARAAFSIDRIANRFLDYPRAIRPLASRFDVFHVVDHSYAHLVHTLPASRTLVTCHDLDAFRAVLRPHEEPRSLPFRLMTRRILSGLRAAAFIPCDTAAIQQELVAVGGIGSERTAVVPNGPHPSCTPAPDARADAEAARLVGDGAAMDLLHVGSTIPRKRIDVLLRVVAEVRRRRPAARLVHVGGPFTPDQERLSRTLGVQDRIVSLPFVERSVLAALYRRSAVLLLPSEREGFGLPVLEAMACGLPVIASDIPALREVGGAAAVYCRVGDVDGWARATLDLLDQADGNRTAWEHRSRDGVHRAAAFSWRRYAAALVPVYVRLAGRPVEAAVVAP